MTRWQARAQANGAGNEKVCVWKIIHYWRRMQLQSILVREIFIAVPSDRDENPVRVFATFTEDLNEMARWLVNCRITTVAMESTGVYWTPLYDVLEQYGIKPCLVDARNMKNVPGRRTDWHECQWLQYLHSVGLLRAAFRPEADVCAVRVLMRHCRSGGDVPPAYPAYAQGADPDEPADSSRDQ